MNNRFLDVASPMSIIEDPKVYIPLIIAACVVAAAVVTIIFVVKAKKNKRK